MATRTIPSSVAYRLALRQARATALGHGRISLRRLEQVFTNAAENASNIIGSSNSPFERARASAMRNQIIEVLSSAEVRSRATILQQQRLTVEDVVRLHRGAYERTTGRTVLATFHELPARTLAVLAARGANAANFRTLVNRHMRDAAGSLDAIIDGAVANGTANRVLARDIASLLQGEPVGSPGRKYGLADTDVSGLKSVWYDARRIAVSEISNAYREGNHQALQASGIVGAVQWQLSGRHHVEDECDELAEGSSEGYSPGFYTLEEWPLAPHPFCQCGQGDVEFLPVEEWEF